MINSTTKVLIITEEEFLFNIASTLKELLDENYRICQDKHGGIRIMLKSGALIEIKARSAISSLGRSNRYGDIAIISKSITLANIMEMLEYHLRDNNEDNIHLFVSPEEFKKALTI